MKNNFCAIACIAMLAASCSETETPTTEAIPVVKAAASAAPPPSTPMPAPPPMTPPPASASAPAAPPSRNHQIQLGPWGLAPYSLTEPFINILHASRTGWTDDGAWTTARLQAEGFIDPETGLLTGHPSDRAIQTGAYMTGGSSGHYSGEWVIEWDTAAGPDAADIGTSGVITVTEMSQTGRLEFAISDDEPDFWGMRIAIRALDAPLTKLALYRKENESEFKAGQLLNPVFRDAVAKYDIYRNMDWMRAALGDIRRADQIASRSKVFFGDLVLAGTDEPVTPTRAIPLNASVRTAVETQTKLWHVAPITLGLPADFNLDSLRWEPVSNRGVLDSEAQMILDSSEWDRHADDFVAALIEEGYPQDRMVYTAVGNEVWNFAAPFARTTTYAAHIGRAFPGDGFDARNGYGVLSARWAIALRGALERAGRGAQPVTFVMESWTVMPSATEEALSSAQEWLSLQDQRWEDWANEFGVAITSYWGFNPVWTQFFSNPGISSNYVPSAAENEKLEQQWVAFLDEVGDEEAARQFADFLIGSEDNITGTAPALLTDWSEHNGIAEDFGVRLIGAYEGGTHLKPPVFMEGNDRLLAFYDGFVHGPEGVRVNNAVNDMLIAAFPGVILSDYALGNPHPNRKDPWHDGTYDNPSPMRTESWARYYRPDGNS